MCEIILTFNARAIIFDLDGTLIDSMRVFYGLVISGLEQRGIETSEQVLKNVGIELMKDFQDAPSKQGITLIFRLFWKIGRKIGLSRFKSMSFALDCISKAREVYYSAPLFPEVKKTLTLLQDEGFQLGICTMASRKQMISTLTRHQIIQFFNPNGLISRNDVISMKPDPEGILLAFKKCSSHPSLGVYIGDMPVDIIAGNRAGTSTIGLTTGLVNEEMFLQFCQPTAIFNSLDHATDWIMKTQRDINTKI